MSTLGVVGYGTIAALALEAVADNLPRPLHRLVISARPDGRARAEALADRLGPRLARERLVVTDTDALLAARPDFLVEAAGHGAVAEIGPAALAAGIDLMISSVGALVDGDLHTRMKEAALSAGSRLSLLPGAIGGLDILAAARLSGLVSVTYVSRKPPAAWAGTPAETLVDLSAITTPTVFFEGSAREAARDFPKNANVAATVALTGLGLDRTRVRLVADPQTAGCNVHEIAFQSAATDVTLRIEGRPAASNPKTSATTGFSLAAAILSRFA